MKTMKLLFRVIPIFLILLITSCGEDPCKTCESTTYLVIDGEQFYINGSAKADYCGEELQEMIDLDYTTETVVQEETDSVLEYTTFITCY